MPGKRLPFNGNTPLTLIQGMHEGRQDDWAAFYAIYAPAVLKLLENYGLSEFDADDVCATVMIALSKRLKKPFLVHKHGKFRNYVATTTRHEVIRFLKDAKKRQARSIDDERLPALESLVPSPPELFSQMETLSLIRMLLDQMQESPKGNKRNHLAFWENVVEGKPAAEVAKKFGLIRRRVFEIKYEGLERLRRLLRELGAMEGDA